MREDYPGRDEHLTVEELTVCLDGAVRHDERARLEAHLSTCPMCFGELVALLRIIRPGRRRSVPEPPRPGQDGPTESSRP
jgi:anti-sigma factor RsiW